MRCHICNVRLEPTEIRQDAETGKFLPCSSCWKISTFRPETDDPLDLLPDIDVLEDALKNYD